MNNQQLDKLDIFLNKASWSYKKYKSYLKLREIFVLELIDIFENNEIDYYLYSEFSTKNKHEFHKREFDKFYIKKSNSFKALQSDIVEKEFEIFDFKDSLLFLKKQDVIFVVHQFSKLKTLAIKKQVALGSKNIYIAYEPLINNKLSSKIKNFVTTFSKFYFRIKILGFKNTFFYDNDKVYKLSYSKFLNLTFEPEDSVNWLLRSRHLNLITNNKEFIKIKDIIGYLKENNNLENKMNNVIEVNTQYKFEEPIHLNRKFWESGNNFFIYPIYFRYRKNVIPYKESNQYIEEDPGINLYSFEYFDKLQSMTDKEVEDFLLKNPIEITKDYITSGRHRVAAMIGRLVIDQKYLTMYFKLK